MAPLIGARDRFTPWVACERSGVAPLIGARDRFTPWVACERSRMAPLELAALGVAEARERIGRGTLSPVALVEACLERIGALDATVQAWVHVDAKGALAAARLAGHAGGRGGRAHGPAGARLTDRGVGSAPRGVLRRGRLQAHARPGAYRGCDPARLVAGPRRRLHPRGRRCGGRVRGAGAEERRRRALRSAAPGAGTRAPASRLA